MSPEHEFVMNVGVVAELLDFIAELLQVSLVVL